ncbi:MAG: hypothetical protein GX557_07045 [Chloroflexi bacterium]|nr:hypothetical protein [Chloroflexota bacterium]
MKASEMREFLVAQGDWLDPDTTVDRIIIGDPDKEVRRVLVTWVSSFAAVQRAVEGGYDLLVTHEPTFWRHANEQQAFESSELARRKRDYILEHGLVILRCHDLWDEFPEIGIPWAWGRFLGLGPRPVAFGDDGYQQRYDIAPVTLDSFAREMARRTATIGEPAVQVVGCGSQIVSKVGVGTGCGCSIGIFQEMGCDLSIVCDDGSVYWEGIQRAQDGGHAVIRVNHGTSEEPGMVTLTAYLNRSLPVHADHLPHGATFRLVGCA